MTEPLDRADAGDRCPACGAEVDDSWLVCAWCGGPLAAPAELPPGAVLADRYHVRGVLGRGGFGITYQVDDVRLQRPVAVKELFPPAAVRHGSQVLVAPRDRAEFRSARDRFLREARVLARFSAPGIVRVYEVFEDHNTAYLVMELLEGRTLADLLARRGRPFGAPEVLDVAARVGAALSAVHAADLLHRDVNPSNIVLSRSATVTLIDFGLARRYGDDAATTFTRVVTPGFAPPEQYTGSGPFGPATDVYGLASTMYRLLTGRTPVAAFDRQAGTPLPSPRELVPDVPKAVADAVLDGLELDPSHRPASAPAFLDRLGLHGTDPGPRALLADIPEVAALLAEDAPGPDSTARAPAASAVALAASPFGPGPDAVGPAPPAGAVGPVGPLGPVGLAGPVAQIVPVRPVGPVASETGAVGPGPARPTAVGRLPVGREPAHAGPVVGPPPVPRPPAPVRAPHPWAAEPRAVGPHVPTRRLITVPTAIAVVALASSTPVVVTILLVLVVLPALATLGDLELHRWRLTSGAASSRWHQAAPRTVAPVHVARNVVVSVMRAVPALALGGVVVLAARLVGGASSPSLLRDSIVRVGGAVVACSLLVPLRNGARGFRAGLGIDAAVARLSGPRGGLSEAGWAVLVGSVALTAAGLWLHPELWPLPF